MVLNELIEYSNKIINGEIVACQKHKWACLRFLNDLKRSGEDEYPYYFDETAAEHFLKWMTLFKHTKGVLVGQNIQPHIIQKFVFGNVYGWRHKETKYRKYNKMYWQVGRKNAKSQNLSCVGSYEAVTGGTPYGEGGVNEVYVAATTREQAGIVYDEMVQQIRKSIITDRFKIANNRITHKASGSFARALSKEDRKTGDGLNPQCAICDRLCRAT